MWHRLVCQPATHSQAITDRHFRPRRCEPEWDFGRLVAIEHEDHTDSCAILIRRQLLDLGLRLGI
jgi:hypothetical protein